ncbi:hypothetical protein AM500_16930 [Bacillus sp. FJAT-18017]|uniref:MerR family transcriptional regulator n=1 Tax=Bacillus sp. FJAT-18017 TaxID=1705566 RepID=UPI0006AF4D61|nr:MerR family transcriptional regulator [Bacillus sp. FJAT-18017]ALC91290.1 hypothetical protein AM500_16930 [Bacillus sp. FJAT-18017]
MYNIKAVSKILDMPTVTIRAWENRYQAITPERNESGHRVYTEENLKDLKWLKKQVQENGINIGQAVKLLRDKKENKTVSLPGWSSAQSFDMQIAELFEAVEELDSAKCELLLDLYFSQFPYRMVLQSIVVPLMNKVGQAWEEGVFHVVNEHMISNLVQQRIMKLLNVFPVSADLPKVMAFCPEGEEHQLGLLMFTVYLRERRYPVYYIGANTPLEGLGELIREKGIEIVALSVSEKMVESEMNYFLKTLQTHNPQLKIIIGGMGVKESKKLRKRWYITPSESNWEDALQDVIQ